MDISDENITCGTAEAVYEHRSYINWETIWSTMDARCSKVGTKLINCLNFTSRVRKLTNHLVKRFLLYPVPLSLASERL